MGDYTMLDRMVEKARQQEVSLMGKRLLVAS
jgi:hypothetical protein